ncbi:MAG: DUF2183 domain-containing protein [Chloroflexi bacterium]|nr:MAG: DUF2183 domain-containing protein [Chloroflexota bacterium]
MADWRSLLTQTTANVEERFDQLKERLTQRLGLGEPLMIQAYHGFGSAQTATIKGRVLENEGIRKATDNDSVWQNLLNAYRQIESDEIPGATVQGVFHGVTATAVSDEEGYFDLRFTLPHPLTATSPWQPVELSLLEAPRKMEEPVTATGQILVVRETAVFGVISDIDDTVLQSKATSYLQAARLLFLKNARTRLPFPGAATFYQALQKGIGEQFNPIFYVSSSPWNVFTLLTEFFEYQNLPQGPLFLKDYGITPDQLFTSGHRKHKLDQINTILDTFPNLPFILIGDSGQKDPEIYAEIAKQNPNRIKAIYIRDVTPDKRDQEVLDIAESLQPLGIDMILAADSATAAEHAAHHNFIDAGQLLAIATEMVSDQEQTDNILDAE